MKFTLLLLLLATTLAVAQPKLTDPLPQSPDIKIGKLANGLTYYIRKNTEEFADLRLVVNAGSLQEDDNQQGLAHFTQHMAFNSTKHFKKTELIAFLQELGLQTDADPNARTSFDETVYRLSIKVDKKANIDKGFTLLEDWAGGIAFNDAEIDTEKGLVLAELLSGKSWKELFNKAVFPKALEGSKYPTRLPIGKEEVLKSFNYDDLRRFYGDWYRPNLMAVIIVGNIDPVEMEQLIKGHFSNLKNPSKERARTIALAAPRTKNEAITLTTAEKTPYLRVIYPLMKTKDVATVGDFRQTIVQKLFEALLRTRTTDLAPKKSAPQFLFLSNKVDEIVRSYDAFQSQIIIIGSSLEPAIAAQAEQLERARTGFTAAELETAKNDLLKSYATNSKLIANTFSNRLADELVRNFLSHEVVLDADKRYEYQKLFIGEIKLEEVNQFAAKTLSTAQAKLVALTTPENAGFTVPTPEKLLAMFQNPSQIVDPASRPLIANIPAPGKVVSTREVMEGEYTELKLDNGITVLLKPVTSKKGGVIIWGSRLGGQSLYGVDDQFNAHYAAEVVPRMGIGTLSLADLQRIMQEKGTIAFPRIDPTSEALAGMTATDIETTLQLIYLFCTQPRRDDNVFKSFVREQQEQYRKPGPESAFYDSVVRIVYNYDPRARLAATPETFAKLSAERAFAIYKERFSDFAGYTFIVAGTFDRNTLLPLITTYIGSLPASGTPPTVKDNGLRPVKGVLRKKINMGDETRSYISLQFNGELPYSDVEKFRLRSLNELINTKLREKLEGDFVAFSSTLSKFPYENYNISISLSCAPGNVDKVVATTLAEIEKIKANGPPDEDLAAGKNQWKQWHQSRLKNNEHWVREMQSSIETKSGLDVWLNYDKYVDELTTQDLKATAKKYLDMKNFVQITSER